MPDEEQNKTTPSYVFKIIGLAIACLLSLWIGWAITGVPWVGIGIALALAGVLFIPGEHPWIRLLFVVVGVGLTIVLSPIFQLLSTTIVAGIPSFTFGLSELFGGTQQQFAMYLNPDYYTFSQRNQFVYEVATDNAGVPLNIEFSITSFESKPSMSVPFDQRMDLVMEIENIGDEELNITRGFTVPILEGTISLGSDFDDMVMSLEYALYLSHNFPFWLSNVIMIGIPGSGITIGDIHIGENFESDVWDSATSDLIRDFIGGIEATFYPCPCEILKSGESYDALPPSGCGALYAVGNEDWYETTELGEYSPLVMSSCFDMVTDTVRPNLPKIDTCRNVVYHPRNDLLEMEACQVEAYANSWLHSRGVLPVEFVDFDYYYVRNIIPTIRPSVASRGSAVVTASAGEQPITDTASDLWITVGFENQGNGDVIYVSDLYLYIPSGLPACDTASIWECNIQCSKIGEDIYNKVTSLRGRINSLRSECVDLTDNMGYIFCRPKDMLLARSMFAQANFIELACPIDITNRINLGDDLRRTYLFRTDAFYLYQVDSIISVTGASYG